MASRHYTAWLTTWSAKVDRLAAAIRPVAVGRCGSSDSEVSTSPGYCRSMAGLGTLAVERGMLRYMAKHGLKWFPTLLQQSQFNQTSVEEPSGQRLSCCSKHWDICWLAMRHTRLWILRRSHRRTVVLGRKPMKALDSRHWLSGKIGRGGNHGGWYYGARTVRCAQRTKRTSLPDGSARHCAAWHDRLLRRNALVSQSPRRQCA